MSVSKQDADPIHGVRLETYAGIQAALADGIPLEMVLWQELVPPSKWDAIDIGYKELLTREPTLMDRYTTLLAGAEDALGGDVSPLTEDLAAWIGFSAALSEDVQLLDKHHLTVSDLSRLARRWRARMEQDAELASSAARLAEESTVAPAKVQITPAKLRAFSWTPRRRPSDNAMEQLRRIMDASDDDIAALANEPKLDVRRVRLARAILWALGRALDSDDQNGWHTLQDGFAKVLDPELVSADEAAAGDPLWATAHVATPAVGATLPFAGQRAAPPPAAAAVALDPAAGLTAPMQPDSGTRAALPFGETRDPAGEQASELGITLGEYAKLCAALADKSRTAETLARYGIADAIGRQELDRRWKARFATEPALEKTWMRLFARYRRTQGS
jgi:hypothetical protein